MLVFSKENEAPRGPPHKIEMQMINGHFLCEKELSYSIFMLMVRTSYVLPKSRIIDLIGKLFRDVWSKTADNNLLVYSMKCR